MSKWEYILALVAIYAGTVMIVGMMLVGAWHLLTPASWHWL